MNESQQVLRYNVYAPALEKGERKPAGASVARPTPLGLGVLVVCLGVWSVLGALFWIPLLLRRIVAYSVALTSAMLAGRKPERAAEALRNAMGFYWRGFKTTTQMVTREPEARDRAAPADEEDGLGGMALASELAWVVLVWYAVLLAVGIVDRTPLDLWHWLAGIPWRDGVVQPAVEWGRRSLPGATGHVP
jgi:hypothetical protein